ncbi:MAG: sporulation protein YabP [Lachnospiraceae bacterium]|nr:sporulation protein YabP [Lachnospiraceae bacterium]MDD3617221.1 sporulation protein YabP [Lachnospiraceae bacterium]
MEIPEKKTEQILHLENRKILDVSGVGDVHSFDAQEVLLETMEGRLTIKGKELLVQKLDLEKGQVQIAGHIQNILYGDSKNRGKNKTESLVGHLFR